MRSIFLIAGVSIAVASAAQSVVDKSDVPAPTAGTNIMEITGDAIPVYGPLLNTPERSVVVQPGSSLSLSPRREVVHISAEAILVRDDTPFQQTPKTISGGEVGTGRGEELIVLPPVDAIPLRPASPPAPVPSDDE